MRISKLCCSVPIWIDTAIYALLCRDVVGLLEGERCGAGPPKPGGVPPLVLWVIRLLNLVFNFLNLFWFSKMLKGAIKVRAVLCLAHCRLAGHACVLVYPQSEGMQAAGIMAIGKEGGEHAPWNSEQRFTRLKADRDFCLQVLTKGKQVLPVEPTAEAQVALTEVSRKKHEE